MTTIEPSTKRIKVVFLDRIAIRAQLRRLPFDHEWVEYPTTPPHSVVERLHEATIAITNRVRIGEEHLSQLPSLNLIAMSATGYDCIDLEACGRHGVKVTNIQDWCTHSVAEHAFALMLALRRQVLAYQPRVRAGDWQRSTFYGLLSDPLPFDLYGSSIGIVGHGSLGKRIAEIGSAFGMRPLVAERKGSGPREGRLSFNDVLQGSDVLCITCPLTTETQGLIGSQELKLMRPTALLINCSRGGIVDDAALANALQQNRLGGAGLDVLEEEPPRNGNPLLELVIPNLIVTPHMAFASKQSLQALAEQLMSNIEAFVAGELRNLVNGASLVES